jgi:hypothetical protein
MLLRIETNNKGKKYSKQGYLLLARDSCYMRRGGAAAAKGSLSYIFLDPAKRRKRDCFKAPFKFKPTILETCLATSLRLGNSRSIVLPRLSLNYKVDNIIHFKSYLKRKIKPLF